MFLELRDFVFIYNNLPNEIFRETYPSKVSTLKNTGLNVKREHIFLNYVRLKREYKI